ncbi:bifunctional biotin--[acetyl-CoA-carboxylase] ligase/biotin operon repressor BirA [Rhabdochromatium marinum]|uniref:bifunctional biotin--[acetyl-CoA-carboxylase] ligase/biotin operon repressor BirA n=1 Tax=Rhabdochromatium marinum TaxID=48729 RepID=UPI0019042572|nr:bifunctional biotin--[acetyl-CoA-carboxylase] ligase/biotin operon repressor BirA [Rhabdochromatium marinum]MBK1649357.1 biotin--[acetyl-CoA-carboxylase] ligase [Rhabdochromatium marinum]
MDTTNTTDIADTADTATRLIRQLADGERHSGAALAAALGISRAAVWKAIQRTSQQFDLEIRAVKGQGYQLPAPLELLDPAAMSARLAPETHRRIGPLHCFIDIDSTNTWLLAHSLEHPAQGTCVLAERQSAGRGRRGRSWHSPFGANLYLSMFWSFDAGPAALGTLSLAAGAALCLALESLGIAQLQLKWPNDLHWQGRKLGGLLIEIAGETQGPSRVVLGLGLNLRMPANTTTAIDQPWVDLNTICQSHPPPRNTLAACCIDQLSAMLASFLEQGSEPWLNTWRRFDAYRDQTVSLHWGEHSITGIYRGIDDQGALLLQTDGALRHFTAGEVSLRAAPASE